MIYRVRYFNPEKPGSGFIDGFKLARNAKNAVEAHNALYDRLGHGLRAEYFGNEQTYQRNRRAR